MKRCRIRGFRGRAAGKGVCYPHSALSYYHNCSINVCVSLNSFHKSGKEEGVRRTHSFLSTAKAGSTFWKDTCHAHTSLLAPTPWGTKGKGCSDFSHVYLPFCCLNFEDSRSQSPAHHCVRGMAFFFFILFFIIIFVCFATGNMDVLAVGKENP